MMEAKKIICSSCNASFDAALAACPYCGTMNYQGAETEYLGDLEGIRQELQDVTAIPRDSVGKEFRRVGLRVALLTLALFGLGLLLEVSLWLEDRRYDSEAKEEYLWEQEHFAVMDQLLEEKQYDELAEYIDEVRDSENSYSVYHWEHYCFLYYYEDLREFYAILSREKEDGDLDDYDREGLYYYAESVLGAAYYDSMTPEVLEYINVYYDDVLTDFRTRWGYSEEEVQEILNELERNDGVCSWEDAADEVQSLRG